MINIKELNENNLKKDLNFDRVTFRYKTGGIFGINFIKGEWGTDTYECYELTGDYNTNGEIIKLNYGEIYKGIIPSFMGKIDLNEINNYNKLIEFLKINLKKYI